MTHSDEIKEVIMQAFGGQVQTPVAGLPIGNLIFATYLTDGAGGRITGPGGMFSLDGVVAMQFINIMFAVPSGFTVRFVEIEKSGNLRQRIRLEDDEIITFAKNGTYTINTCRFNFNFK